MKRNNLVTGTSIIAVILLSLTSISNVVGYQSVQTSQQNLIKERINQRELLFQTIVDIANNKEIQRIILKSQISRGISPPSEIPVITKNQLRQMYLLGLMLSKFIRTSRIQSMSGKYQFENQVMQKEISVYIEKDVSLNAELTQLKGSECDCENQRVTGLWTFPVLCLGLYLIFLFFLIPIFFGIYITLLFAELFAQIAINMNCFWIPSYF